MIPDTRILAVRYQPQKPSFNFEKLLKVQLGRTRAKATLVKFSGKITIDKLQNTNKFQKLIPNDQAELDLIGIAR